MINHTEFGGCLPREKCLKETRSKLPENIVLLNTGRSAIYAALLLSGKKKIMLPYYTCPTIKEFLILQGIEVREYNIDNTFMPVVDEISHDELILCTDYYGCTNMETIDNCARRFANQLILDNCQSFFSKPIDCLFNIYSPRKFLGISCGGVLLSKDKINTEAIEDWLIDNSSDTFLDIAEREGSNQAYGEYCKNEIEYRLSPKFAPESVINVLEHADYDYIRNKRKDMFDSLLNEFGEAKELPVDYNRGNTAYVFPMWVDDTHFKEKLVAKKIYCSTWWRKALESSDTTKFEKSLVTHLVPIPVDHRYSDNDINILIKTIREQFD